MNEGGRADSKIFNIGNPQNDLSIRELAEMMIQIHAEICGGKAVDITMKEVLHENYYGEGYEDMVRRVPDITQARELLGWEPKIGLQEALRRTISHYVGSRADEVSATSCLRAG